MGQRWIKLILIAFVILGTLYSVVVPLFEAPDEVWHYLYVKHFADGNGLPVYREGTTFPMRQEASQPPLFYVLNGWATAWIDTHDAEQIVRYNPHAAVGTAAPWGNRNMMGHTSQEQVPLSRYGLGCTSSALFLHPDGRRDGTVHFYSSAEALSISPLVGGCRSSSQCLQPPIPLYPCLGQQ